MEGRQIDVPQARLRNVDGIIIAAAFGGSVTGEVLGAGHHTIGCGSQRGTLESPNLGGRHGGAEVGIFTGALNDSAPAGIPRDIDHRSEGPVDAGGPGFSRRDRLGSLFDLRIPGGCHGQWDREDRAVAVDDVQTEQDRDVEPGFIHRHVLDLIEALRIVEP